MTEVQAAEAFTTAAQPSAIPLPAPVRYRYLVGDLRTGQITTELPFTSCPWTRVLNNAGSIGQAVLPLTDPDVIRLDPRNTATPARAFLAVEAENRIVQAGPIWAHRWDSASRQLSVGAAGLWSLFDHRTVMPYLSEFEGVPPQKLRVGFYPAGNYSLADIAKRLVDRALSHVGGDLPLVLPADQGETPGHQREYWGYDLPDLGEALRNLTGVDGGPDIRFTARRQQADATRIEWVMQAGTPSQPDLSQPGDDWWFDQTAPKSPVVGIDVDVDGSRMVNRAWVTGNGSEQGRLMYMFDRDDLVDLGWPRLEGEEAHPTVTNYSTVYAYARDLTARRYRPVETWQVQVRARAALEVVEGDYCQVVHDDPYLGRGRRRCRVVEISGGGQVTTLSMAPLPHEVA